MLRWTATATPGDREGAALQELRQHVGSQDHLAPRPVRAPLLPPVLGHGRLRRRDRVRRL